MLIGEFTDTHEYSEDKRYRWWYERRWGPGDALCWVGLNPSTGDTTGRARPTLGRVVDRARGWGLDAVIVVNLFSYRSTDPRALKRWASQGDIVGGMTDDVIIEKSRRAAKTLAAWGGQGSLLRRGERVTQLLRDPLCLGRTRNGEPRHPLYARSDAPAIPYER